MDENKFLKLLPNLVEHLDQWSSYKNVRDIPSIEEADRQKLTPHIISIIRDNKENLPIEQVSKALDKEFAIQHKRNILIDELVSVNTIAEQNNISYVVLRGFSLQSYYPKNYIRQFNDIDILVKTEEDLALILPKLQELGYFIAKPLTVRYQPESSNKLWMGIALNKIVPELDHPIYLDVTLGGPSISFQTHYSLDEISWERITYISLRDIKIPSFAPIDSILVLLSETFERTNLYIRDLLDLHQIIKHQSSQIDYDWLSNQIKQSNLENEYWRFYTLSETYGLTLITNFLSKLKVKEKNIRGKKFWLDIKNHILPTLNKREINFKIYGFLYYFLIPIVDKLEDKYPLKALNIICLFSPEKFFKLGLPIYLFPDTATEEKTATLKFIKLNKYQCVVSTPISTFQARIRPLYIEGEW